jgi:hypothetical protein
MLYKNSVFIESTTASQNDRTEVENNSSVHNFDGKICANGMPE